VFTIPGGVGYCSSDSRKTKHSVFCSTVRAIVLGIIPIVAYIESFIIIDLVSIYKNNC
jgi:hypothetical protein